MPCGFALPSAPRTGSVPMVGSTLSPADRLTNSAKGTSHTHRPKKEAIMEKLGTSTWS
ncbi:hypothetical protein E4U54_005494, partial [Claviceps lovelessii]